jgi:hypothetical protein
LEEQKQIKFVAGKQLHDNKRIIFKAKKAEFTFNPSNASN